MVLKVPSATTHFEMRRRVRKTWGGAPTSFNDKKVFFFLGKSGNDSIDDQIARENKMYGDIIQAGTYYFFLKWSNLWKNLFIRLQRFILQSHIQNPVSTLLGPLQNEWRSISSQVDRQDRRRRICNLFVIFFIAFLFLFLFSFFLSSSLFRSTYLPSSRTSTPWTRWAERILFAPNVKKLSHRGLTAETREIGKQKWHKNGL